jgi:hypothetical protein
MVGREERQLISVRKSSFLPLSTLPIHPRWRHRKRQTALPDLHRRWWLWFLLRQLRQRQHHPQHHRHPPKFFRVW